MKRFIICVLDHTTNTLTGPAPIFSDSEENARLYAEELAREVAQDTPVHIYEMTYVDSVKLGFSWQRNGNLFKLAQKKSAEAPKKPNATQPQLKLPGARKHWTEEEIALLKRMVAANATGDDMARVLHRSRSAIHSKCWGLRIGTQINKRNKKAPQ